MTLKGLRAALLAELASILGPRGYRQREQSFVRQMPGGWSSFHIAFVNHVDDFDVMADVAIRFDAVEDVLNAARPLLSVRDKRRTATIGAQLANIAGDGHHRWTVRDTADISATAGELVKRLDDVGEPFLLRFASPAETLRVLEADGPEARLICPFPEQRAEVRRALHQIHGGAPSNVALQLTSE